LDSQHPDEANRTSHGRWVTGFPPENARKPRKHAVSGQSRFLLRISLFRHPFDTILAAMDSSLHAGQLCFRGPAEIWPGSHRKMAKTEEHARCPLLLDFPVSPVTSGHHSSGQARGRTPSPPDKTPMVVGRETAGGGRNYKESEGENRADTVHALFTRGKFEFPAIWGLSGNLRPPVIDPKHPPTSGRLR